MKQIRQGVFETNSSSTHSIVMCIQEEYNAWENGELYLHRGKFVTLQDAKAYIAKYEPDIADMTEEEQQELLQEYGYLSEKMFFDSEYLETFYDSYTTPSGETVIAFGLYGYDG